MRQGESSTAFLQMAAYQLIYWGKRKNVEHIAHLLKFLVKPMWHGFFQKLALPKLEMY